MTFISFLKTSLLYFTYGFMNMSPLPFYIKVDGQAFSGHRDPQGIYEVEVLSDAGLVHSAYAALEIAKEYIPFLDENSDNFTLRAFTKDGTEVIVKRPMPLNSNTKTCFCGRVSSYPSHLND